jgi:hypothetical protein
MGEEVPATVHHHTTRATTLPPLPHYLPHAAHTQLQRNGGEPCYMLASMLARSLTLSSSPLPLGRWARTLPYSGFIKNCHSFFLPSLHRPACLPACWIPAKEGTSPQPTTTVVRWSWTSPLRRWPVTSTRCIAAPSNLFFEVKPPLRELLRQVQSLTLVVQQKKPLLLQYHYYTDLSFFLSRTKRGPFGFRHPIPSRVPLPIITYTISLFIFYLSIFPSSSPLVLFYFHFHSSSSSSFLLD